jgi:hypothetical protein
VADQTTLSERARTLVVAGCCGRRVVLAFGLDCTGRCSGDRDTRPKAVGLFDGDEGEDVVMEVAAAVDTRRLPVKLFNVRRISSALELAWSNAMVAPDCFESSKKLIPRKVRTNDAVMFESGVQRMLQCNKYVACCLCRFLVMFLTKLWRDGQFKFEFCHFPKLWRGGFHY